jgi:hypothetical protein
MLIKPQNAVDLKDGFKIWNGNCWDYYKEYKCTNCGKIIIRCTRNAYQNSARGCDNNFCSKKCQSIHRHNIVDPIGANILNQINTPNFCYLIGLLATDGHITYPPNYVHYSCSICLKDLELLEQVKNIFGGRIQTNHPFIKSKDIHRTIYEWKLNNIEFIQWLISIGFTNNKSHTLNLTRWFNTLTEDLQKNFIRGVLDGDGSIYRNAHGRWGISIVSASLPFIQLIKDYTGMGDYRYDKKSCYYFSLYRRGDIEIFLDRIYNQSTLHLDRKYKKYQQFKLEYAQHKDKIHKTKE